MRVKPEYLTYVCKFREAYMCHGAESSSLAYPHSFDVRASTEIQPHRWLFIFLCSIVIIIEKLHVQMTMAMMVTHA